MDFYQIQEKWNLLEATSVTKVLSLVCAISAIKESEVSET